jgi:UDP-N-acetylmuramoylalanine--D-glutamate ligase
MARFVEGRNVLTLYAPSRKIVKRKNQCHDERVKTDDIKKLFAGKKITLMGLGLLGRGVGDAEFLAAAGANLIVTDLKNETELASSIERLKKFPNITYHLGGHLLEDFENRDMILRAPNVPLNSPFLARARENNIPIEMDASLFVKLSNAKIVGITGTRGKSTTTHLIYEMAKAARLEPLLGGNERGTSTLQLLEKISGKDPVILELDSWQLQGFEESRISPHVSIWTNFMPDHMNYYKGDMGRYFADKAAIARFQKKDDYFITTSDIKERIESRFGALQGTFFPATTLQDDWIVALPGEHNRQNAGYAVAAARILGIPDDIIKNTLKSFSGLPGRLEFLGEKNGIAFYDDANSTTPEAAVAALRTLAATKRPIVLIAGGSDKELDFKDFAREIEKTVKKTILFKGKATEKLEALLPKESPIEIASNMSEAVTFALVSAKNGDIVLLSPGATSFGIFKNEYDRGDQFRETIKNL